MLVASSDAFFSQFRYAAAAASTSKRQRLSSTLPVSSSMTLGEGEPSELTAAPGPYISQTSPWRERFTSVSSDAFRDGVPCPIHNIEKPLRCLLVGHNPSDHSWRSGTSYSNPTNRFWGLLREGGVLPASWRPLAPPEELCNNMAGELGIGITDVLCEPGSDASTFRRAQMLAARDGTPWGFYARLRGHTRRAGCAPQVVAFIGKRQWSQLFEPPLARCPDFIQDKRPPKWPLPPDTVVVVLNSPSGRNAAVTPAQRLAEYERLASMLHSDPTEAPAKGGSCAADTDTEARDDATDLPQTERSKSRE